MKHTNFYRMKTNRLLNRLLCIVLIALSVESSMAQTIKEKNINLDMKNAKVEEVIKVLAHITHIEFFYEQQLLDAQPPVNIHVVHGNLKDVLRTITKHTGLVFHRNNRTITIGMPPQPKPQPAKVFWLTGRVTDTDTQEPLAGANVYLPEYLKGEITNEQGEFKLPVAARRWVELAVSFVGYKKQQFRFCLTADSVLNVALREDTRLSEVQVYASRHDFGAENSQMSAVELPMEQVKSMPVFLGETDVLKALQKLPGVQQVNDGTVGIYVRGGNYDQNLITLDGTTLYNSDHLNGFVSAMNADMIDDIVFYKGAFPARYGARLSGVVDIGMKEGDFEKHRGLVSLGLLSSRAHVEGPLWKEKTSFNLGVRFSYFDLIVQPLLEDVYNKDGSLQPYSHMNYYDVNAKLVHRFSEKDKLSAMFYWGRDVNNSAPSDSHQHYRETDSTDGVTSDFNNSSSASTENTWGNVVGSLSWTHRTDELRSVTTGLSYSRYHYRLKTASDISKRQTLTEGNRLAYLYEENSYAQYHSGIDDVSLTTDFRRLWQEKHDLRWGGKLSLQQFNPVVDVYKKIHSKQLDNTDYVETSELTDTVMGSKQRMASLALYAEDDYSLSDRWRLSLGLRYSLFAVKGKGYHSLEPRASVRYMLSDRMSIKASYSRMAQAVHLLSSSNLVMPSDLWVPVTKKIPLMTSDQWAVGYNFDITRDLDLSVEAYYKTMNNVIDYREGASYMKATGDWQDLVAVGKGRAYGAELLLQKKFGRTTGWIGYTLSWSLRRYDRPGQEISGGDEFYAGNDRRHNLNIVFRHRFNRHWDVSASWTYQTGRRGVLATTGIYGGKINEYDSYGVYSPSSYSGDLFFFPEHGYGNPEETIHFHRFTRYYTYTERNGFRLPDIHRLDVGVNYATRHQRGETIVGLSIYNVYNRQNTSKVYIGHHNNQPVLKGVCMFPFMPSLNFTIRF